MREVIKWVKGSSNKEYVVGDLTNTTRLTGPLPVSVVGVGGTPIGGATTATLSNVADTATSTTLLAANTARLGATLFNDSTEACYVKFGATASTTSFTVFMMVQSYYEVPFGYSGIIDGIWVANASGSMRVTELT